MCLLTLVVITSCRVNTSEFITGIKYLPDINFNWIIYIAMYMPYTASWVSHSLVTPFSHLIIKIKWSGYTRLVKQLLKANLVYVNFNSNRHQINRQMPYRLLYCYICICISYYIEFIVCYYNLCIVYLCNSTGSCVVFLMYVNIDKLFNIHFT